MQPQIAPNTGNIGRLCVATGADLHIVRPMGFVLSDKNVRRSGMDYWDRLRLTLHDDDEAFFRAMRDRPLWLFTSKSTRPFWDVPYSPDDCLVFGSETHGLSDALLARFPDRTLRIPQAPGERCLNLSTAAGIALYEALRQQSPARQTAAPPAPPAPPAVPATPASAPPAR
jgi:tRNA (cytidine/uridine-2'-O-)-methyltransferase